MNRSRGSGFTLVEMLVAIAVSGIVLLLAHGLALSVTDATARAEAAVMQSEREANRHLWLVRAFGNAVAGSGLGFRGVNRSHGRFAADEIEFATVVRVHARHERRKVHVALDARRRLVATPRDASGGHTDTLILADSLVGFGAEYLIEFGADARWVREWASPVSLPVAVRLRLNRGAEGTDTLVLHVGAGT